MTTASDLDRRVTIERATLVPDGGGGFEHVWSALATVSASRRDVSESERVSAGRLASELLSRFVIRAGGAAATVNAADRIAYASETWEIIGVKETEDGRNRFLEITAKTGG